MVILGIICIFLSFVLLIMGLMAWGAMTTVPPTDDEPNANDPNEEPRD